MSKMTFLELALKVLEEEQKALTVTQIWEKAKEKGYTKILDSEGKTPEGTLWAVIYRDEKKEDSPLILIDERPKRYILRKYYDEKRKSEIEIIDETEKKIQYKESDLHPFLAYYCANYLQTLTVTIRHERSLKREHSQWLHPDMVGWWHPPITDWNDEVREFSKITNNLPIKLYSFEIKRKLNFSNLRESFFQTVSNSSWANQVFLVAAEIDKEDDFHNELSRLSSSFGIGLIQIDVNDPDSTEIIYPARDKEYLDWDTINKLAKANSDFQDFLNRIRVDITSSEIREEKYDTILDREKLLDFIKKP